MTMPVSFNPKITEREPRRVNFFVNPGEIPTLTGVTTSTNVGNGTGELQSNYGQNGPNDGAYKGVTHVGRNFDTLRDLGIYGF